MTDTSFKYSCKITKEGSPEMTLRMTIFFNIANKTFFHKKYSTNILINHMMSAKTRTKKHVINDIFMQFSVVAIF